MRYEPHPILTQKMVGTSCCLVPLSKTHTPSIIAWRNDPSIAKWFNIISRFEPISHERWLAAAQASGRDFNFVIEDLKERPIGTIALYDIQWENRSAEFGRLLIGDPAARRSGQAREATKLLLAAAASANIDHVHLEVKAVNIAAITLYVSLGFKPIQSSDPDSGLLKMVREINNGH
ncbi:GNAT family N-acetyltransferase [Methylobacterium longum]|uniref:GNAT family N-acetyltransferase n=1 Tax=Methylobacterium longum TaxID=767694 RepID=A0ABT8AWZ8_9HYPH|nr:GNAT family N-acetyltransferase [Methylobacterium longum]MDN3573823.1 GNAT family N-acetyltransferase [Methylobacterium longum]